MFHNITTNVLNIAAASERRGIRKYRGVWLHRETGEVLGECDHLHVSDRVAVSCVLTRLRAKASCEVPTEFTTLRTQGGQTFFEACASLAA